MARKVKQPLVKADLKQNRLYITFNGDVRKVDVEKTYTDIRFAVADLQPGFAVINDLSSCKLGQLSGVRAFKRITDYLCQNGVGQVIRVVGKKSIIFKQISKLSLSIEGYKPQYVSTLEEAENILNK